MAYQTYTTEAIVCGRTVRGEHDITLRLYTKDAGMIFARAGGGRAGESKLRYGLQDFSYSTVSLVHGRHEWRVTGASPIENFYYTAPSRAHRASLLASIRLIRRLVQGGAPEPELFSVVLEGIRTLAQMQSEAGRKDIFLLRLLHRLGYVSPQPPYAELLHADTLESAHGMYQRSPQLERALRSAIEKALLVSHL